MRDLRRLSDVLCVHEESETTLMAQKQKVKLVAKAAAKASAKPAPGKPASGKSPVGKSTIANLLVRMYDVSNGEICIDGKPIQDFSLSSFVLL